MVVFSDDIKEIQRLYIWAHEKLSGTELYDGETCANNRYENYYLLYFEYLLISAQCNKCQSEQCVAMWFVGLSKCSMPSWMRKLNKE